MWLQIGHEIKGLSLVCLDFAFSWLCIFFSRTESCCIGEAGLELEIFLPESPEHCDHMEYITLFDMRATGKKPTML